MKNKVLKLTALSFCAALLFTSCKKDDKEKIERGDVVGVWYHSDLGAGSNEPTEFHGKVIELHITSDGSVTRWETYPDTVYDETGNYTVKLKQWVTMGVLDGTGTDLELNGTVTVGDPKFGKMADKWVTIPKVTPFTVNGKSIQINDYKINWFSGNEKVITPLCCVRKPFAICNDTIYHFTNVGNPYEIKSHYYDKSNSTWHDRVVYIEGNDTICDFTEPHNLVCDWKKPLEDGTYTRTAMYTESILWSAGNDSIKQTRYQTFHRFDCKKDTTIHVIDFRTETVAVVKNGELYLNQGTVPYTPSPKYMIYNDATIKKSAVLASDVSFKRILDSSIIHSRTPKKTVDAGNYVICWGNRFTVRTSNDGKVLWFKYNTNEGSGSSFTETYLRR